jgi:hypothetical protein
VTPAIFTTIDTLLENHCCPKQLQTMVDGTERVARVGGSP